MPVIHTERPALPPLPDYINMRAVRRMLGDAAPSTINAMVADGLLPEPVRPRANLALFDRAAVLAAVAKWPRPRAAA